MANGDSITQAKIIMVAVSTAVAINGALWLQVNKQAKEIDQLTTLIYQKMDDRYRRWEAEATHKAIIDRIRACEKRDDHLENQIQTHIVADDKIHK